MAGWAAAIQAAISLYGDHQVQNKIGNGVRKIQGMAEFNPQTLFGNFGNFGMDTTFTPEFVGATTGTTTTGMRAQEDAGSAASRGVLGVMNPNLLAGGMFNDQGFQNAFNQGNAGMAGDFGNAQNQMSQMMGNSAFGNLGMMQNGMMGAGFGALNQAQNQNQLIGQNLAASNALAQPFENDLINRTQDRLFAQGRLGSSGGSQEFGNTMGAIMGQGNQRILNAQQLGLQQQGQLQQFGLGAMGQAGQFEGQQFGQNLGALQQNQSAGQSRLQNAMGMFGLGRDTFGQQFGLGLQGQQGVTSQNQFMLQALLGIMNSENSRIGATGQHANAMAGLIGGGAAESGGMFGGLGSMMGGMDFGGG